MNIIEIKQYIEENYDDNRPLKGEYLSNDQVDWLILQAEEREYYEILFKTYYNSSQGYFNKVHELQDEISKHIKFLDKVYKGWEDQWNFEALQEENRGLKHKIKMLENKDEFICPNCYSSEHIYFTINGKDNKDIPVCEKCNIGILGYE